MTTYELLRKRYPENEYALMAEVRNAAGFDASRSADFVAVNLWPSRGLHVNGIEVKSFRSDWLSELKKPEKAESIFKFCDFWWLLTTDENVAKPEEIPPSWGWLCIKGEKILVKKDAPKLEPLALTRGFICAMLKRAGDKSGFVHVDSIKDKIEAARESGKENSKRNLDRLTEELRETNQRITEFAQLTGIDISYRWSYNKDAAVYAMKCLMKTGGPEEVSKSLERLAATAKQIHTEIVNAVDSLNQLSER